MQIDPEKQEKIVRMAGVIADRWKFMTTCCYTYDETNIDAPVALIPPKPYLPHLVHLWETKRLLCLPKSRRMIMSWSLRALELHLAMFEPFSAIYLASNKQDKSDAMLGRHKFLYDNLPGDLIFRKPEMVIHRGRTGLPTRIDFPEMDSKIVAVSSDPDELRQEGATLVVLEELATWDHPREAWPAILPVIQGGGRIVIVSSAIPNSFFQDITYDNLGQTVVRAEQRSMMRGA